MDGDGKDRIAKSIAYSERFGRFNGQPDYYLLSEDVFLYDLERAKQILVEEGRAVKEVKVVGYDNIEAEPAGAEINVDGRRFSLPRDAYLDIIDEVEVDSEVISIKDKSNWPKWLLRQMDGASYGESGGKFELTPKTASALGEIAVGSLVPEMRDLAIHLRLGDRVSYFKGDMREKELFAHAKDRFGVDDVAQVRQILSSVGVRIIDTSPRLSRALTMESRSIDEDARRAESIAKLGFKAIFTPRHRFDPNKAYSPNERTEIDALLEAIHKTM